MKKTQCIWHWVFVYTVRLEHIYAKLKIKLNQNNMTALQKLISEWESMKSFYLPYEPIFDEFIKDAKKMLEMEKQQIIQAHEDAYLDCGFEYSASDCANDYYNKKFGL